MRGAAQWLATLVVAGLLAGGGALAQEGSPDVPPGPASVVGQLVHETRPEAVANVDVLLYALAADGSAGLRPGVTDDAGRFRFEGVSNAPDVVYLVGARTGEIPFGSRFSFAPGEREHRVEVALSDPLSDPTRATVGPVGLRIERGCTHLRVSHSHAVTNPDQRAVYVPADARDGAQPIFEVRIPEGAEGFESLLGREGVERDGARIRFWGPVYPGTQEIEFGYGLAMETREVAIALPRGAPELTVLAPEGVLTVSSPALAPAPAVALGPQRYAAQRAGAIAPGGAVELAIALSERPPSPIRTPRAELWLELDDAALEVNERLEVVTEAPEGIAESLAEPLLCMPLPTGARELRFSPETLRAGLRRDPSGDVAIHGPLPAGSTSLAVSYRLPATGAGAELLRRYDRTLPLLSVLVADNGVVAETERLHRRRAVRSGDRMYLHLEAFAVESLEPVELHLRRTAPRSTRGRWASTGFALLAGLAALGFLGAPLRGRERQPVPTGEPDPAEVERLGFVHALEDLDDDLETGKLTRDDHAAMRTELRARAAALLLREPADPAAPLLRAPADAAEREDVATAPQATACAACGAAARTGDVFCAKCGAKLDGGASAA